MLTKNAAAQIKAGPDDGLAEGEFTAYASVFGNKDSYGDVVMPGAFTATLAAWAAKGNPIPLLFGHNMSDPDFNIGEVLEAVQDETGLRVRARLDLQNPKAAQVYRMIKGRRINQMSFAYDVITGGYEQRAKDTDPTEGGEPESEEFYALRELKLYEVSVVTIGANQETEILAVKSVAVLADRVTGDIKAGRVLSAKNETEIRTAHEALSRVLEVLDADEEKASGHPGKSVRPDAQGPAVAPVNPSVAPSAVLDVLALEIELSA
ncbi:HK97 family phage prohead protease [Nocardia brasiliensis]|uniref:HK97 family phage prohead protease n=1 Tax=Nocardia brasiliensis TaxID=37326 RepID=UPI00245874C4|nr:HK97 family phage prohead protease [Nocardia brasiliensis]